MKVSYDLAEDKNAKLVILSSLYSSLASIAQEIRGTTERLTIWSSGLILVVDGWIITGNIKLDVYRRVVICIGVVLFGLIAVFIIRTMETRYRGVAYVTRRINEIQMAHQVGAYLDGEALYPLEWRSYGTKQWKEPIFRVAYVSLSIVTVFGAVVIWIL
jgi:hypothetical protein